MTLHQQIKKQVSKISAEELLKKMGYQNPGIGRKALKSLCDAPSIYEFLKEGHFDFKYGSEDFLRKLGEVLDIPQELLENEIAKDKNRIGAIAKMEQPYIFVNTRFRRNNEPIFALALMERTRNIQIDKELLFEKNKSEILGLVSQMIQEHYAETDGKLPLWGKIHNYIYHHIDGSKFIFGVDGKLQDCEEIPFESKAELLYKNKNIAEII